MLWAGVAESESPRVGGQRFWLDLESGRSRNLKQLWSRKKCPTPKKIYIYKYKCTCALYMGKTNYKYQLTAYRICNPGLPSCHLYITRLPVTRWVKLQ